MGACAPGVNVRDHFFRVREPYNNLRSVLNGHSKTARMMRTSSLLLFAFISVDGASF
jgi:hypothetical protein